MDLINHIPFGLREGDQRYVDVADVPKGRKCGCICPSCHISLIARQGNINRWHFAHASRKLKDIEHSCEYSFFVSVRAMAKQILMAGCSLSIPGLIDKVSEEHLGRVFFESFCITIPGTIILDSVRKEIQFEDTIVDVCADINGYPLVIYFSHPGRTVPSALESLRNVRCGILEIDLTFAGKLFISKTTRFVRFEDEVGAFLEESIQSKKWIYHPREASARRKAQLKLAEQIRDWDLRKEEEKPRQLF